MRTPILLTIALVPLLAADPVDAKGAGHGGSHYVRTYTTRHGTTVQGHYQTNANHTRADNWSTRGNTNPYTGKAGTKPLWQR